MGTIRRPVDYKLLLQEFLTQVKSPLKYCRGVLPNQVSLHQYSSVINEEAIKKPLVPILKFEDVEIEHPVSHSDLCDALQICDSMEEQMLALASTLSLSPEDIERRVNFCKSIESLLRPFFGKIKIQMFGSTLNGYGFKGCDIDMSFETFADPKDMISYLESSNVPLVSESEVMGGKITPYEMSLLPRQEKLLFVHSVLLEYYKESESPTIYIPAHTPLIRFYHDKYNLKCDLTYDNRVAYANTKLLYLFGKLDERVTLLMKTIRYLAKHTELIGKGDLFNTYTITLLVIHFLQTCNPPILPSAEHILSLTDSLEINDMDDDSFLNIRKFLMPSENTRTLSELLRDFFFFYCYFDFTRVICPLISASVPREKFFADRTDKKFVMNSICVQDPMQVSHNVAELVDYKNCKRFKEELITVCKIFQDNTVLSPSSSKWGLLALLDKPNNYLPHNLNRQRNLSFSIPLLTKPISNNIVKEDAHSLTAETLMYFLKHVLLFECKSLEVSEFRILLKKHDELMEKQRKVLENINYMNSQSRDIFEKYKKKAKPIYVEKPDKLMLEEFQELNSKHKLVLCAKCEAVKNVWEGRDFVSLELFPSDSSNDLIEKQRYISLHAARQNELNSPKKRKKSLMFFFECYVSPNVHESSLLINFRPFQTPGFYPILGLFLKDYVPKLIKDLNDS